MDGCEEAALVSEAGALDEPEAKERRVMALSQVEAGRRVRVAAVRAGRGLYARLAAMGMAPGAEVEVIHNSAWGPFIVLVRGSRIMLGRGMTDRIEVE